MDKEELKNEVEAEITTSDVVNDVSKENIVEEAIETSETNEQTDSVENTDEVMKEQKETFKQMSPFKLMVKRFFRSKLSVVGLVLIIALFLFSFIGPLFSPYGQAEQDNTTQYLYTTEEKTIVDENGDEITVYVQVTTKKDNNSLADPSQSHWLGTDEKSYDVMTRLMYGGRISLTIGFVVVILETIIGVLLGGLAGYFGGWVDSLIMRIVDIFNCIPTLPILLIASMVIDAWKLTDNVKIYFIMIIITVFSWSGTARIVRGQILYLREQEYITATEVMGLPTWRRILKHLIPNVMPQLIVSMTLGLGSVILYESTLSYLGLGVSGDTASWGTMISCCKDQMNLQYHMNLWLPAGFMIVLAVLAFNFVGDGLRDAMDPKSRK